MTSESARNDIMQTVKALADAYKIQRVYLFGSYARREETDESDIDLLVYGGNDFKLTMIFAFAEELRQKLNKNVDVFEIRELNQESSFYKAVMEEMIPVT